MSSESTSIIDRLRAVRERIAAAERLAGREVGAVELVAVSKTVPVEVIRDAIAAGQRSFGENYVQELRRKYEGLAIADLHLHLIGPLQRNKVRKAVRAAGVIETVDSKELARAIAADAAAIGKRQQVMVQINISGEQSKSGVVPEDALLLCSEIIADRSLELCGLMAIGAYVPETEPLERRRADFVALRSLRDRISANLGVPLGLSMGMSHDYELAIQEGATVVRVGSALFGERPRKVTGAHVGG